jgi:hypothetical protein
MRSHRWTSDFYKIVTFELVYSSLTLERPSLGHMKDPTVFAQ